MRLWGLLLLLVLSVGCTGGSNEVVQTTQAPTDNLITAEPTPATSSPPITRRPLGSVYGIEGRLDAPEEKEVLEVDVAYKNDDSPEPSWLVVGPGMSNPPWEGAVYMVSSSNGLNFVDEELFIDRAGVPNLLLTSDNELVATFQYFSYEYEELFDVIAYTVSEDFGKTWSSVRKITIEGKGFEKVGPGGPNPVDPTLIQLDDGSFRLYFTFHKIGEEYPGLFSAHSESLESAFQSEGPQLEASRMILDPAVVEYNGEWHHYTVLHGEKEGSLHVNVHSVSQNGNDFEVADDIPFDFQFLGQVIEDGGKLRFYGTGNGIESATSTDGYTWKKDSGQRASGADPGIAKLPEGTYLMVYTRVG